MQVARGYLETKCKSELTKRGYWAWIAKDQKVALFRLFNVLALSEKDVLFVQCRPDQLDINSIETIRNLKLPRCCKKEIWRWTGSEWHKERFE